MSDNGIVAVEFDYLSVVQCRTIVAKVIMFDPLNYSTQGTIERIGDNVTEVPYHIIGDNHDLIAVIVNDK